MLPESIELVIVTPERQLLREAVAEVTLPGAGGCLGILPGHAPLITELGIGELTYRKKNASEPVHMAIISGFAEVLGDSRDGACRDGRAAGRNRCGAGGRGEETRGAAAGFGIE